MKRIKQAACTFSFLALTACGGMEGQDAQVDPPKQGGDGQGAPLIKAKNPIPGQYIVVLKDDLKEVAHAEAASIGQAMALKAGGQVFATYKAALNGFAIKMPEASLQQLLMDPRVAYVEEDQPVAAFAIQSGATWGIDRVDQRGLPLSGTYNNNNVTASNVHAYVIDTGVRLTHTQFSGRMGNGFDAVTFFGSANDCHGHGTHVAGTIGGTTYGLAKGVTIHPVRVLDCDGSGSNSGVIAGVDWVRNNHIKPAVANMSLGGGVSQALDNAVTNLVNAGVMVAVAAGNEGSDACGFSPARAMGSFTVGATASNDVRASYSNFGSCVDIFAPGSSITSAWSTGDTATSILSGTSMATPHVAGAAALYLSANPNATPQEVRDALVANGTRGVVGNPAGSANVMLYTGFIAGGGGGGGGGTDITAPTVSITAPTNGSTVRGTTTINIAATDNVGVTFVDLYLGNTLVGTDTTAPYSFSWNTSRLANGTYTLRAQAFDAANNVGSSSVVSVSVNNNGACATTSNLLSNPGFEGGNVTWVASPNVIDGTMSGSAPRTGSWKAWLNGFGAVATDSAYQTITIPSGACSASLSFWMRITSAETDTVTAYDNLTVTIRNTSNTVLSTLATYSTLNKSTGYVQKTFDLSAFRGQTIRVYFNGTEDSSLQTSFFIDDVAVTISQ